MEDLQEQLFGEDSSYTGKFVLARSSSSSSPVPLPVSRDCDDQHQDEGEESKFKIRRVRQPSFNSLETLGKVVNHPHVADYLAPHELLSLWRCCSFAWNAIPSGRPKKLAMLPSVFRYLRISEDAAAHVDRTVSGGWNAFLPKLVQVCSRLAGVYYPFEPDAGHRIFVTECLCHPESKLPFYERNGYTHNGDDDDGSDDDDDGQNECVMHPPQVIENIESAFDDGSLTSLTFGDPIGYHEPTDDELKDSEVLQALRRNREWMRSHAESAPNEHYQRRVKEGRYPLIVLGGISDTEGGVHEWSMGIGPNMEQCIVKEYTGREYMPSWESEESFHYCKMESICPGGYMGYLTGFPCGMQHEEQGGEEDDWGPHPTLGIAIWCYRHSLDPFANNQDIDWIELIETECMDDDNEYDDTSCDFFIDALTNPRYGPANIQKWCASMQRGPPAAAIQWYNVNRQGHRLTWSSFCDTINGFGNCFVYLDASWRDENSLSKPIVDEFLDALQHDDLIHIRYCDVWPNHSAFRSWWSKQNCTEFSKEVGDAMLHIQFGKVISCVLNLKNLLYTFDYGNQSVENPTASSLLPPDITLGSILLYLFAMGRRISGAKSNRKLGYVYEPVFRECSKIVPPHSPLHEHNKSENQSSSKRAKTLGTVSSPGLTGNVETFQIMKGIEALHASGKLVVGESIHKDLLHMMGKVTTGENRQPS